MALRPRFIRTDDFVAVKPIRLTGAQTIEAGTEIKLGEFRLSQLKRWYRRRRIARAGSQWAINVLAGRRGETMTNPATVDDIPPPPPPESNRRIESSGQWHTVYEADEEVAKIRGKKALEAWLSEHPETAPAGDS